MNSSPFPQLPNKSPIYARATARTPHQSADPGVMRAFLRNQSNSRDNVVTLKTTHGETSVDDHTETILRASITPSERLTTFRTRSRDSVMGNWTATY